MKRFYERNKENLSVIKNIVSVCNCMAAEDTNHNMINVELSYTRFIKIIMYSREIYTKFMNDFISVSCMAEYYNVSTDSLNRIIAIGSHSCKNHNYILKNYKKNSLC